MQPEGNPITYMGVRKNPNLVVISLHGNVNVKPTKCKTPKNKYHLYFKDDEYIELFADDFDYELECLCAATAWERKAKTLILYKIHEDNHRERVYYRLDKTL